MMRTLLILAIAAFATPAIADGHVTTVEAAGSVDEAADRLEAAVTGAGATVFARVDHAGGARSVDMELPDATLMIFGNPRIGTPVMQSDILAGLVLPLRVLVYEDGGQTMFAYEPPAAMLSAYDVPADLEAIDRISGALENLTAAASE